MSEAPTVDEMHEHLKALMRGVNAQLFQKLGNRVLNGPFQSMWIPECPKWEDGNAGTKLLGSYEFELHETVIKAAHRQPSVVVNIGCAEGYYAVGFALALPNAIVYARDLDPDCLDCCIDSATHNGVEHRVAVGLGCTQASELEVDTPGKRLYFLDCEGAELDLLDHKALITSDVIVECHDFLRPDISSTLAARFEETHDVELIKPKLPRLDWPPFQAIAEHPAIMAVLAIVEKRPLPTAWLACWAK